MPCSVRLAAKGRAEILNDHWRRDALKLLLMSRVIDRLIGAASFEFERRDKRPWILIAKAAGRISQVTAGLPVALITVRVEFPQKFDELFRDWCGEHVLIQLTQLSTDLLIELTLIAP